MRGELSSHAFCSAVLYVRLEATVDDSLFFTTPLLEWTTLRRDLPKCIEDQEELMTIPVRHTQGDPHLNGSQCSPGTAQREHR